MILQAKNLFKAYKRTVVDGISFTVTPGKVIGLLGPNGAGKTTTFQIIAGLTAPDKGYVQLGEQDITHFPIHKRAQQGIAYLPQKPSIFRELTVTDNIMAMLEQQNMTPEQRNRRLAQLLDQFQLTMLRNSQGSSLSGGERRRVEIARAIANNPKYLLLDEPFAGIDPIAIADIHNIIHQLKAQHIGILITDHNAAAMMAITDYIYLLIKGKVFKEGPPGALVKDPQIREKYLGPHFIFPGHLNPL